jgi:hypothetical protein
MPFLVYLSLLCCYLASGYGLLRLFRLRLEPVYTVTLSLLLGLALASFLPFLLQLCYVPITGVSVFGSILLAALLLNIPSWMQIRKDGYPAFRRSMGQWRLNYKPYELPFWLTFAFFVFVSAWRCYYLPPTSRDALSGPEAIAEFAVREHTLINSFFHVDLWSTNNQFKSPFLISLQVIYKLAGFPFGQVWLTIVFVCFLVFIYHALRERVHPILAGVLVLLLIMTPETYAYTFLILYDYSNMVYFFLGLYFLFGYFKDKVPSWFYFAGLLLGIATYIRSETLVLALLFLPPILLSQWREFRGAGGGQARRPFGKIVLADLLFFLPSLVGYWLPSQLYIQHYLPVHYDIGGLVNKDLSNLNPLFQRYSDIYTRLLTGELSVHLWGYLLYLTAILFVAEALFTRSFTKEARNWLYAIAVVYLGLGALGWLLPVIDLTDTTKRALFKELPLVVLYLASNQLVVRLSQSISRWESAPPRPRTVAPAGAKPAPAQGKAVLTKTGKTAVVSQSGAGSRKATQPAAGGRSPRKKK